jgi:rhamnosyl/mannosyltransferase
MRVLHVGKYFPPFAGGVENFHGDLCAALERVGIETLSLVHDHSGGRLEKRSRVRVAGSELKVIRSRTYGEFLYAPISPGFVIDLVRAIQDFRPDIIHVHMPNLSGFWLLAVSSARAIPWVVHWHADVVASGARRGLALAYRGYRPFERMLLSRAKRVIVTSPPYLESSEPLRPWRAKCEVIPLGLDQERFSPPKRPAAAKAQELWNGASHRVLAVGRLTYYKGHVTLLEATAGLSGARVVIVGEGVERARLQAVIHRRALGSSVCLAGYQSDEVVRALLASCSCLCLPSVERTEAFGLVLLEAMRFGKPAVVTDVPGSGMSWVVEHGNTGLVVRMGDSGSLRHALADILYDEERRLRLGRAARNRFDERFRIERPAARVAGLYHALVAADAS